MRRTELIELHDHPSFPAFLRDLVTDALQSLWQFGNSYSPILPRLYRSLAATSSTSVLDLCAGGGGPWLRLARQLEHDYCFPVYVRLTDKYPNREAFEHARLHSRAPVGSPPQIGLQSQIDFVPDPVDATRVPATLGGFRTIFSSFHHFRPEIARQVLSDAVAANRGIAIFELAKRDPITILILFLTPLFVLLLTPGIRPFRWSRLLWTYLVPIVPFVIWFDGLISCMRAYAPQELQEMVRELEQKMLPEAAQAPHQPRYRWQVGEEVTGILPVTFLRACLKTKQAVAAADVRRRYGSWFPLRYGAIHSLWRAAATS